MQLICMNACVCSFSIIIVLNLLLSGNLFCVPEHFLIEEDIALDHSLVRIRCVGLLVHMTQDLCIESDNLSAFILLSICHLFLP